MSAIKPTTDPYRLLGIPRGADLAQIKAAHRRLAKRHHPDAAGGDEARFLAVQEAYQLLSDPLRRRDWDRRHAPGPVDARERAERPGGATRRRSRAASSRWTREEADTVRRQRPSRRGTATAGGATGASSDAGPNAAGSGRDPGVRRHTWTAQAVPWWEDFTPRQGRPTVRPNEHADRPPAMDFDVFNRSSGAAWSSAARRHFRRDEADLPSRGAFRYRGSQVVTGAEARKVAAEEDAEVRRRADAERRREEAEEALMRDASSRRPASRQAFDHDPAPTPGWPGWATSTTPTPQPDFAPQHVSARRPEPRPRPDSHPRLRPRPPLRPRPVSVPQKVSVPHEALEPQASSTPQAAETPPSPRRDARSAGWGAVAGALLTSAAVVAAAAAGGAMNGQPDVAQASLLLASAFGGGTVGFVLGGRMQRHGSAQRQGSALRAGPSAEELPRP